MSQEANVPQHGNGHGADSDAALAEPARKRREIVSRIITVQLRAVQKRAEGSRQRCAERKGEERIQAVVQTKTKVVRLPPDIEEDGAMGQRDQLRITRGTGGGV